jgi:hypothetical protein
VQVISDYTISSISLPDASLDFVLNRHGGYNENELFRLLRPGVSSSPNRSVDKTASN